MIRTSDQEMSWRECGQRYFVRILHHILLVVAVWLALLVYEELRKSGASPGSPLTISEHWSNLLRDTRPALVAGALTLTCFAWAWSSLGLAAPRAVSLFLCFFSTLFGGLYARFPIPDRAPSWMLLAGGDSPRIAQWSLIALAALVSCGFLMMKMTRQYERLNRDRLALSPDDEDVAVRSLVQSVVMFLVITAGSVALWNIANFRPVPAVAQADQRDQRPSVLFLAVDSPMHSQVLQRRLGEPFFRSWVIFGSPDTGAKFDEVLQCRYPIRLIGQNNTEQSEAARGARDFFVAAALESLGYSTTLLHTSSRGEASEALKMLSRNFAHVRFFRRFGLLLPSRVYYTPDVQLSQIREALGNAVGRAKPAFVTASLLSRGGRQQTRADEEQFETFFDALQQQNWLKNILVVIIEFPSGLKERSLRDLSVGNTSAQIAFYANGQLGDSALVQSPPKLVRGIDVGASLAARLRLEAVVTQCDGAALFDLSERPSVFPRDLVYQEIDLSAGEEVFRKRGWLTSDGYRLELQESHEGALVNTFKFELKQGAYNRSWEPVDERLLSDPLIKAELTRQIDDFLRTTGVEVLALGNGRTAYSE
ncbi:MAG: hypothetical protein RL189_287, partial [Pseudomonadota bacterium]